MNLRKLTREDTRIRVIVLTTAARVLVVVEYRGLETTETIELPADTMPAEGDEFRAGPYFDGMVDCALDQLNLQIAELFKGLIQ